MIPLIVGALAGLAKSELVDRPQYEKNVASRAIQARFAPLQGKASPGFDDIQQPSALQSAINYGLAGAAFGQQFGGEGAGAVAKNASSAGGASQAKFLPASNNVPAQITPAQQAMFSQGAGPISAPAANQEVRNQLFADFNYGPRAGGF